MRQRWAKRGAIHPQLKMSLMAGACLLAVSQGAGAFEIDSGNPDVKMRLDTTVRYNIGIRAKDCDVNICGNDTGTVGDVTAHQSDRKFSDAGDIITNRIDLLPEFDFIYKERHGFRVSAAAWYDAAYSNKLEGDAAFGLGGVTPTGPIGSKYSDYTKRWVMGPSGEFLDAFIFTGFDLGDVPVNLKLGQHNVYWGESLFSFVNGISYGQGPVDIRKAQANPGIEAKEVFKPINQLSFNTDFTDRISLSGQYQFDWKPSTLPEGGTYWGAADFLSMGGGGVVPTPGGMVPFNGVTGKPAKEHGDWGLALKWRPEFFDARLGFYYREYSEKLPQLVLDMSSGGFGLDYSTPKAKMYGFSMGKQVGDLSVGMDLTYRKGAQLTAQPLAVPAGGAFGNSLLPRGDVFSGVVNAIAYFGKTAVYDSAALTAEVNFAHLDKITHNPVNPLSPTGATTYYGEGYACPYTGFPWGCPTKNSVGIGMNFEPKWFQVWDGVDVTAPMFVGVGIKGNSPVPFGSNKGQGSYSLGVNFDIQNQYSLSVAYNGNIAKHENDAAGATSLNNSSLGKYWDRDWVSITFKTTF